MAGNVIWAKYFTAKSAPTDASQGSKKGGRASSSISFIYSVSALLCLGEGPLRDDAHVLTLGRATPGNQVMTVADDTGEKQPPQPTRGVDPGVWKVKRVRTIGGPDQPFKVVDGFRWPSTHWHNFGTVEAPRYVSGPADLIRDVFSDHRTFSGFTTRKQRSDYITFDNDNYPGAALVANQNMHLGSNASIPNWNFPFRALERCSQVYGYDGIEDADPARIAADLLTNPKHGGGWDRPRGVAIGSARDFRRFLSGFDPDAELSGDSPFWGGGLSAPPTDSWSAYCRANNILLSPTYDQQRSLAEILQELALITNTAFVWSEGTLKAIPYGTEYAASSDTGVVYLPTNDPNATTPGANIAIRYDLTTDHFLPAKNDDPVQVTRTAVVEDYASVGLYNKVTVEGLEAFNGYATAPQEAANESSIAEIGLQARDGLQLHLITNPPLALDVARRLLERSDTIRNLYRFRLGWEFCLLEPMDFVTITDPSIPVYRLPIRITSIEESPDGVLEIEGEDPPGDFPGSARPPIPMSPVFAEDLGDIVVGGLWSILETCLNHPYYLSLTGGITTDYECSEVTITTTGSGGTGAHNFPGVGNPATSEYVVAVDSRITAWSVFYTRREDPDVNGPFGNAAEGPLATPIKGQARLRFLVNGVSRDEFEVVFDYGEKGAIKTVHGSLLLPAGSRVAVEILYQRAGGGALALGQKYFQQAFNWTIAIERL